MPHPERDPHYAYRGLETIRSGGGVRRDGSGATTFHLPRVAIVGDREIENVRALVAEACSGRPRLDLAGVFVPGFELDGEILRVLDLLPDIREGGVAMPIMRDDLEGVVDFQIESPLRSLRYAHVPYDIKRLKTEAGYRKIYCEQLLDHLRTVQPDWILLANFKLVLDRVVTAAFPGRIVNIHPSVLPLNKGFRTERMADPHLGNKNPEALGYTIHLVSEDLDGGPTLFQQQVEPDPFDESDLAEFETRELFNQYREEVLRLKVIRAQAKYSAQVMSLVASGTSHKIVEDAEAFSAEGRPGFEKTEACLESVWADFDHFKKTNPELSGLSFEDWFSGRRKPYQRVLFLQDGEFRTLEAILGSQKVAPEGGHAPLTRYIFQLSGDDPCDLWRRYGEEILSVLEVAGRMDHQVAFAGRGADGRPCLFCSVFTTMKLGPVLRSLGIDFTTRVMPVSVTAKRRGPDED